MVTVGTAVWMLAAASHEYQVRKISICLSKSRQYIHGETCSQQGGVLSEHLQQPTEVALADKIEKIAFFVHGRTRRLYLCIISLVQTNCISITIIMQPIEKNDSKEPSIKCPRQSTRN